MFQLHYVWAALPQLLIGAAVTLEVSILAIALGLIVSLAITACRRHRFAPLRVLAGIYISFARGTPLFIQVLIVYFTLPVIGLDVNQFVAGVIALSFNSAAYITEIIRGGLNAIAPGQIDAARAIGLKRWLIWRDIILPQTFVVILPPLTIELTAVLKASALLSVIAVVELTRKAQEVISDNFRPVEIWVTVGVLYFVMCRALGMVTKNLEARGAMRR
jgi:His/Glu/Gln/Arg/opine family amino acid ABC transporter permease subunit